MPGRTNVVADTLSRPPCDETEATLKCNINTIKIDMPKRGAAEIRTGQMKDDELKQIINSFESDDKNEDYSRWTTHGFFLNNGFLYHYLASHDEDEEEAQLVVPHQEQEDILKIYHNNATAGHFGINRTYHAKILLEGDAQTDSNPRYQLFSMPTLQSYKFKTSWPPTEHSKSTKIRGHFYRSILGPLPETPNGNKHIFIIEGVASRWTEPLPEATAENCAQVLLDEIFLRFGTSRRMISDSGPQFISAVVQKLTFCLGIHHVVIPFVINRLCIKLHLFMSFLIKSNDNIPKQDKNTTNSIIIIRIQH